MAPTIPIVIHNMDTKIEDRPLPWYIFNAVIDLDTGDIPQSKYLMQVKKRNRRPFC